jgi:hypothetical protein
MRCLNGLLQGVTFTLVSTYSGPCDLPIDVPEPCPPEIIKKCCKPIKPTIDTKCCPPPNITCPPPKIINNVTCPPPIINNIIKPFDIKLDGEKIELTCPAPVVFCEPKISCPPPIIKNEIIVKCPEKKEDEGDRYCDLVELEDEEAEICAMRGEPNHIKWMMKKEAKKQLMIYAEEFGWPLGGKGEMKTMNFMIAFGKQVDKQVSSSPEFAYPSDWL